MKTNTSNAHIISPKPLTTKGRILEAARILFNQHGTDEVSTRQIATELGISHGNLCYHFPHKEDIIEALYKQLAEAMNAQVLALQAVPEKEPPTQKTKRTSTKKTHLPTVPENQAPISLQGLLAGTVSSFEILYQYKFLMLDFVSVMRKLPSVRAHYTELVRLRKQQFTALREQCVREGWMKAEVAGRLDETMNEALFIVGDFWMASAEILYEGEESKKIPYYAKVMEALMIPLLTEKGLRELAATTPAEAA
ncbi:MAG: TetR family transcriptional regulator [Candidatus Kapabacteria bacterium]|nr:TetR family transcriptional regulator [Candidatus Kapabacteria bacterium]